MFSIVDETRELLKKENELSAQIIRNLQKISDEHIHLEMGFSSLFTFCVKALGMSEAMAYRRCDAVKMSSFVKDLPTKLEQGSISLNRIGEVSKFMRQERKEHGRSFQKKEVQKLVAQAGGRENDLAARKYLMSQSAKPEARPSVDRKKIVPGGRTRLEFEVDDEFIDLLEQTKNLHSHWGPKTLGVFFKEILKEHLRKNHPAFKGLRKRDVQVQTNFFGLTMESRKQQSCAAKRGMRDSAKRDSAKRDSAKRDSARQTVSSDQVRDGNVVSGELSYESSETTQLSNARKKVGKRKVLSHESSSSSKASITGNETRNQKRLSYESACSASSVRSENNNRIERRLSYESKKRISRSIPVAVKREVWARDKGRCTFEEKKEGRRCNSEFRVQFEHLKPFALGGDHSIRNLTLRCQAHNLLAAKNLGLLRG